MKKLIFTVLAITAFCVASVAQSKSIAVYKNGVKLFEQHASTIDSVVFVSAVDTVKDIDGNVYRTITYTIKGKQVTWMIDNLRTTKLNDGTPIYNTVNENADYADGLTPATGTTAPLRTTPAYCWHMNQTYNKEIYGGLYNHYAIETGKLAPKGWHVATNQEWIDFENTLATVAEYNNDNTAVFDGTALKVAKAMASQHTWASTSNWKQIGNNPNANNKSGFSLVACGYRSAVSWGSTMNNGFYWTATTITQGSSTTSGAAYSRNITNATEGFANTNAGQLKLNSSLLQFGVRCVKDAAP